MSDQLISVPLKKTSDLNLDECLKPFFAPYTKRPEWTDLEKAIKDLDKLRKDVVTKAPQKTIFMLEQLYRYHDQINLLSQKFPSETPQPFTWIDSFNKISVFSGKASLGLPYLGYEKHCVLFNIGALQTQLAVESSILDTDDEKKNAAKYFQNAAGIFEKLRPAESAGDNLTPDFHPDLLSVLSAVSLAQAQEIFVSKAIKDKMKDGIIAKLCSQTEEMYSDVLLKMTRETVKYSWDKTWLSNAKGKKHAYFGLANLFQSKVCGDKKMIGEQISRLNVAIESLKKGQDKIGNPNFLSYFVSEAKRFLTEAEKDNNFIYHEVIVPAANLPTIQKAASARLAKITPVPEKLLEFNNPFEILQRIDESIPAAPPRKKKTDEVTVVPTQSDDVKDDSPKNTPNGKSESPKPSDNGESPPGKNPGKNSLSWNQLLNDSWSLLKSEVTQAAENYVYGKK